MRQWQARGTGTRGSVEIPTVQLRSEVPARGPRWVPVEAHRPRLVENPRRIVTIHLKACRINHWMFAVLLTSSLLVAGCSRDLVDEKPARRARTVPRSPMRKPRSTWSRTTNAFAKSRKPCTYAATVRRCLHFEMITICACGVCGRSGAEYAGHTANAGVRGSVINGRVPHRLVGQWLQPSKHPLVSTRWRCVEILGAIARHGSARWEEAVRRGRSLVPS